MRLRNARYDKGSATVHRVSVPVISVGNLTLGGTGKTPTVEWLARRIAERGLRLALVSRGYGAKIGAVNDEARELAEKLPGIPHVLDADRVRGCQRAIDEHGAQVLLLDDGFQHRRLHRDLDIVLIDATEPFGFEHVFPRGTLREPLAGWQRAHVLLLTRSELVSADQRAAIRHRVQSIAPQAVWAESAYVPHSLRAASGEVQPLSTLAGRRVAAFCGIGNPASFRRALEACGCQIVCWREWADHHPYGPADANVLAHWSAAHSAELALCTHKDLVKIGPLWRGPVPLLACVSQLQVVAGEAEIVAALDRVLAPRTAG